MKTYIGQSYHRTADGRDVKDGAPFSVTETDVDRFRIDREAELRKIWGLDHVLPEGASGPAGVIFVDSEGEEIARWWRQP